MGTSNIPANLTRLIRNNAGGAYNHLLFFKVHIADLICSFRGMSTRLLGQRCVMGMNMGKGMMILRQDNLT